MVKAISFVFVFAASAAIAIGFQNCGGSSIKANNSGGGCVSVTVGGQTTSNCDDQTNGSTDNGDNSGDGSGGGANFSVDLNRGDNILYLMGGGLDLNLASSRIASVNGQTTHTTTVYEQRGTSFPADLNEVSCGNSAFPHCNHINGNQCTGSGCYDTNQMVRCHWQAPISSADWNNLQTAIAQLRFTKRVVNPEDPQISDCAGRSLNFFTANTNLEIYLGLEACVPEGDYFAANDSGAGIKAIFENEISGVRDLADLDDGSDFCNNYSAARWNTTKIQYTSNSGFTTPENAFRFEMNYENARADLKFKEMGETDFKCATGVQVSQSDAETLFPQAGIKYEIHRMDGQLADAPTTYITYEDPSDGGAVRLFSGDRGSAASMSGNGGAVMDADQVAAIKNVVENILVNRAKDRGQVTDCAN